MYNPKIPYSYHISKGADNVFFILNDGEDYLRKLSTDYDTAKKLAVKLIKENDPDFFKDGNKLETYIWNRDKWNVFKNAKPHEIYYHDHICNYNNYIAKAKTEKAITEAKAKYSFVGDVGDILDLELTIKEIFSFVGDYGFCMAHKFEDIDGNSLIYFGNSKQLNSEDESKFKVGDKITVTATIKRHTKSEKDVAWTDGFDSVLKPVTVISKPKLIKERKNA
jgi:hypothetical protein